MADNMPENNNINNAAERMAPVHKPEENFGRLDSSAARENLDAVSKLRESKESSQAAIPPATDAPASSLPDDNGHLNKFLNDIDREKLGKIQELINVVFAKGPEEGVLEAKRLNDPYVLDELQKLLTEEWMHKILVERGLLPDTK